MTDMPPETPQHHNLIEEWVDIGPGPCAGEIIRARNVAHGAVFATIRQRKGYKSGSLMNPNPGKDNELQVVEEWTSSMVFVAGARFMKIPDPNTATAPSASPPAPTPAPGASSPEPVPGAAGAGATESR